MLRSASASSVTPKKAAPRSHDATGSPAPGGASRRPPLAGASLGSAHQASAAAATSRPALTPYHARHPSPWESHPPAIAATLRPSVKKVPHSARAAGASSRAASRAMSVGAATTMPR